MTWVDDAADAHVAALDRGRAGERYIVAGGYASVRDICAIAVDEAGTGRVPHVLPESAAVVLSRVTEAIAGVTGKPPLMPRGQLDFLLWRARADSSKAREELGIEPLDWEESVRRTVRWIVAAGPRLSEPAALAAEDRGDLGDDALPRLLREPGVERQRQGAARRSPRRPGTGPRRRPNFSR